MGTDAHELESSVVKRIAVVAVLVLATACGGGEPSAEPTDAPAVEQSDSEGVSEAPTPPPTESAGDTTEVCALLKDVHRQDRATDKVLRRSLAPLQKAKTAAQMRKAWPAFLAEMKRYTKQALKESRTTYAQLADAVPSEVQADIATIADFSESFIGDLAKVQTPQQIQKLMTRNKAEAEELGEASARLEDFSVETCGFSITG